MENKFSYKKTFLKYLNYIHICVGFLCLILVKLLLAVLVFFVGAIIYDKVSFPSALRAFVPDKIEITKTLSNDGQPNFSASGVCGSASFLLSEKTAAEIERQGLAFFEDIQMKQAFFRTEKIKENWGTWKKQVISPEVMAMPHNRWSGYDRDNNCTDDLYRYLKDSDIRLTDRYYTTESTHSGRWATILIYPRERLVVFHYMDW